MMVQTIKPTGCTCRELSHPVHLVIESSYCSWWYGYSVTHCMTQSALTLLKEGACNIEVVVVESFLQRSVTFLQGTAGDNRKREWRKCTLVTHAIVITTHGIFKQHLLLHGVAKWLCMYWFKLMYHHIHLTLSSVPHRPVFTLESWILPCSCVCSCSGRGSRCSQG